MERKQMGVTILKQNMKRTPSQNGFTLLEVLMATVILSVGLLALASMTVTVIRGNARANQVTIATTLAQEKIEELRGMSAVPLGYTDEPYGQLTKYAWARRETRITPDAPEPDVNRVEITVSVKDPKGGDRSLAVLTVLINE